MNKYISICEKKPLPWFTISKICGNSIMHKDLLVLKSLRSADIKFKTNLVFKARSEHMHFTVWHQFTKLSEITLLVLNTEIIQNTSKTAYGALVTFSDTFTWENLILSGRLWPAAWNQVFSNEINSDHN